MACAKKFVFFFFIFVSYLSFKGYVWLPVGANESGAWVSTESSKKTTTSTLLGQTLMPFAFGLKNIFSCACDACVSIPAPNNIDLSFFYVTPLRFFLTIALPVLSFCFAVYLRASPVMGLFAYIALYVPALISLSIFLQGDYATKKASRNDVGNMRRARFLNTCAVTATLLYAFYSIFPAIYLFAMRALHAKVSKSVNWHPDLLHWLCDFVPASLWGVIFAVSRSCLHLREGYPTAGELIVPHFLSSFSANLFVLSICVYGGVLAFVGETTPWSFTSLILVLLLAYWSGLKESQSFYEESLKTGNRLIWRNGTDEERGNNE